ncbi:MAG: ABC transporter permease [Pseudomonadota bacterium]
MNAVAVIASRELREGIRNKWVLAATAVMAALAVALAFLGTAPVGTVEAAPLEVLVVSLASLAIFLVPLIALLLAFDGIVGEAERGTLLLLLAYPVARWQVVAGKFLGQLSILAFAIGVGFGLAGLAARGDEPAWAPFLALIGSSVLLGAVFLALGLLLSTAVRQRATAAGAAVALWLLMVVVFDLALLAVLVAADLPPGLFRGLLAASPADAFRLLNLTGFEGVRAFSGLAGAADEAVLPPALLVGVLAAWVAVPLAAAAILFTRRQP